MAAASASTATAEKWIGFDMDECMAQCGVLYYFLYGLPADVLPYVVNGLARKEQKGSTWILRPAFCDLLPLLGEAFKAGMLKGVILYSNNGSHMLVNFIGDLMEAVAGAKMVVARLSAEAPEKRTGKALLKNLEFLQKHVSPSINHENLLFFDDLPDHTLSHQLVKGNYVQVDPYMNQLHADALKSIFATFITKFSESFEKYKLVERAERAEKRDFTTGGKTPDPPDDHVIRTEMIAFRDIFQRFLGIPHSAAAAAAPAENGKTRRRHRRRQRKFGAYTRKCRRPSRSRTQ